MGVDSPREKEIPKGLALARGVLCRLAVEWLASLSVLPAAVPIERRAVAAAAVGLAMVLSAFARLQHRCTHTKMAWMLLNSHDGPDFFNVMMFFAYLMPGRAFFVEGHHIQITCFDAPGS